MDNRLRVLDLAAAPEQWEDIERRVPRSTMPPSPSPWRRVLTVVVALAIGVAGTGVALVALRNGGPTSATAPASNGAIFLVGIARTETPTPYGGPRSLWTVDPVTGRVSKAISPTEAQNLEVLAPRWTPDGSRVLWFTSDAHDGPGEIWTETDGTLEMIVSCRSATSCVWDPEWSPDGTRIAFARGQSIWIVNADGSDLHELTTCEDCTGLESGPTWSPDGSQIAFAVSDAGYAGAIHIVDVRSGRVSTIAPCDSELCLAGDRDANVVWSPTRDLLLFTRERNLWSVRTDGTDLARLTSCEETEGPNPCAPQTVAWSPDGNQIAYIHGDPTRLTIMGADGSDARDLELPADHSFYLDGWQPVARSSSVESPTPEASPTAGPLARESIVFTREEPEGGGWRCDLFTTEPDGTEKRPLTVTPSTCETGPAVAPGGSAVAVSLDLNDIAVIDLVTSTVHRLTDDPATLDSNPAWSPDGSQIAFSLGPEMGPNHIYVMNADGTDVRQLTDGSDSDRNPAWSPDGTRIAFARSGEVYVMDADGSNVTAVTALAAESAPSPAWSPDGSQIALDVDGAIYVMTVNGTGLRRLSPELPKGVLDQHPSWSPDGTQIAFSRYTNEDVAASAEDGDIWIIDADGTDATRVTRGPAIDSWPQWVYGSAG